VSAHALAFEIGSAWFLAIAAAAIGTILIAIGMMEELIAIVCGAAIGRSRRGL